MSNTPRRTYRDLNKKQLRNTPERNTSTPSKRARLCLQFEQAAQKLEQQQSEPDQTQTGTLKDDEVLCDIVHEFGYKHGTRLIAVNQHVPKSFPQRNDVIKNIMSVDMLNFESRQSEIEKAIQMLNSREIFVGDCKLDEDFLWKCTKKFNEPYNSFLIPPVENCLVCDGMLYHQSKIHVTLFTLTGPKPAYKVSMRCKKGCGANFCVDRYTLANEGQKFYPGSIDVPVVRASTKVYLSREVHELMCEAGNHGFVSHHAFTEIYNSLFAASANVKHFEDWLSSQVTDISKEDDDEEEIIEQTDDTSVPTRDETRNQRCYILSRKKAMNAYLNGELLNEIRGRGLQDTITLSSSSTREDLLRFIDSVRRKELYHHKVCSHTCKEKGCTNLRVIDSCWKVCMPHCMFAVEKEVKGIPLINFPNVCTNEPKPGSVFCTEHHTLLESKGIPTKKEDYLKHIGCKSNPRSAADIQMVDEKTSQLSKTLQKDSKQDVISATDYQGTTELIGKIQPDHWSDDIKCNKDTGEKARLRQRSRGHFISVTGGGHIMYFEPIFKSESPGQIFMIVVRTMMLELDTIPEHEQETFIENYILSYDNICHLDSLKAAKEDLPFPEPYNKMWKKINKVIDRLHIANHKDPRCQEQYHPDSIPEAYNTMVAEQTFAWFSRFKKIANSMSQSHHLFYIHRNIQRRNRYTEQCHVKGREPLLPGINSMLGQKYGRR